MTDRSARLVLIALLLLAGIMAGAQLGKIAPLVPWFHAEAGLSLSAAGWLASLIGVFVALLALPAGWAIGRWGSRPSFLLGSLVQAAGAFLLAAVAGAEFGPAVALGARLVEALGYLVLVIAIPALLARLALPEWRSAVLALWGGFVPLGFATADLLAAWLLPDFGPRTFLFVIAGLFAFFALLSAILLPRVRDAADAPASGATAEGRALGTPAWSLAFSFGAYVVASVGFFAFLPTFLNRPDAVTPLSAGAVALFVPLGNILAGLVLRGRGARTAAWLALAGLAAGGVGAAHAFAGASGIGATLALAAVAVGGGATASALFAAIPLAAGMGAAALVLGLVAQAGGIGTVIGPPLAGLVIERAGWTAFGWFIVGWSALAVVALWPLLRRRVAESVAAR